MVKSKPTIAFIVLAAGLGALVAPAAAQPVPLVVVNRAELKPGLLYDAWVEFKDKGEPNRRQLRRMYAALEKEFDPRAIVRRKANRAEGSGLFDERDLPLIEKYLKGVEAAGAKVQIQSRWFNGVTVIADKGVIEKLEGLPFVKAVGDFHQRKPRAKVGDAKPAPEKKAPAKATAGKAAPAGEAPAAKPAPPPIPPTIYGVSDAQTRVLNLEPLHQAGFMGKGVRIAIVDCGFQLTSEAFHSKDHPLRIFAQRDFVENDADVRPRPDIDPGNYSHGTLVLGSIAAYKPGVVVGSAYDADIILANAEDGDEEYYLEERWFDAGLEWAEKLGADIVTSSLVLYGGYKWAQTDGKTAIQTRGMSIATENGVICFAGAGNSGHDEDPAKGSMMPPGDSAETICVGAVDGGRKIARFSSDGPSADGRLKPEVLSDGVRVGTVSINDPKGYGYASGTSLATPVLAGASACLLQTHPGWTMKEFKKALFESGDYWRREGKTDPLFVQGYGIPDVWLASGLKDKRE